MKKYLPLFLLLVACSKSNEKLSEDNFIELSTNHTWIYLDSLHYKQYGQDRKDTLIAKGTLSQNGKQYFLCSMKIYMILGIKADAIRADSNSIYLYDTQTNKEIIYFRKVYRTETVSTEDYIVNSPIYLPFPLPDPLPEPETVVAGKIYHIAYPELYTIGKYQCYKNERITKDNSERLIRKQTIYVSPHIGIVRAETFNVDYRWNPSGLTLAGPQWNLLK